MASELRKLTDPERIVGSVAFHDLVFKRDATNNNRIVAEIQGYFSTIQKDRYRTIILPTAFSKSFSTTFGLNPVILKSHDPWERTAGRAIKYGTDNIGAWVVALIDREDTIDEIVSGNLRGMSWMGIPEDSIWVEDDPDAAADALAEFGLGPEALVGVRRVYTQVDLIEITLTPIPANPYAIFDLVNLLPRDEGNKIKSIDASGGSAALSMLSAADNQRYFSEGTAPVMRHLLMGATPEKNGNIIAQEQEICETIDSEDLSGKGQEVGGTIMETKKTVDTHEATESDSINESCEENVDSEKVVEVHNHTEDAVTENLEGKTENSCENTGDTDEDGAVEESNEELEDSSKDAIATNPSLSEECLKDILEEMCKRFLADADDADDADANVEESSDVGDASGSPSEEDITVDVPQDSEENGDTEVSGATQQDDADSAGNGTDEARVLTDADIAAIADAIATSIKDKLIAVASVTGRERATLADNNAGKPPGAVDKNTALDKLREAQQKVSESKHLSAVDRGRARIELSSAYAEGCCNFDKILSMFDIK